MSAVVKEDVNASIKQELEGQTFLFYPINKNLSPMEVTVRGGKIYVANSDQKAPVVGVRWTYLYDCFKGVVNPPIISGTTPAKESAPAGDATGGRRAPSAPRRTAVSKPGYIADPGWDGKDPPPIEKSNNKEMFWTQKSFKDLFRLFYSKLDGVNTQGANIKPLLEKIIVQWTGNSFEEKLTDSRDTMVYLDFSELKELKSWMLGLEIDQEWVAAMKTSSTAILKRINRWVNKYEPTTSESA